MKLLWSKPVPMDVPWEPAYAGVFCKSADKVHFIFKEGKSVGILSEDSETVQKFSTGESTIPLPTHWILSETGNDPKLFFNNDPKLFFNQELLLNIPELIIEEISSPALAEVYRSLRKPEKYYVEASFCHEGYCISHKGNFGYRCTKDGEVLWEFRGQGYLYTDICFRGDRIYFGTAGQGGYFYVLNLHTGAAVAKIKTGGTASIIAVDDVCYILCNDKTAKLLCVDLTDGSICSDVELPGKTSVYSRLKLMDGKINAITFSYKKDCLQSAIWNCIAP